MPPVCDAPDCRFTAAFWLFRPGGGWQPSCEVHLIARHPSLEVHAWLESGYAKPVELDRPQGPPSPAPTDRSRAFRTLVEEAMGWTVGTDSRSR